MKGRFYEIIIYCCLGLVLFVLFLYCNGLAMKGYGYPGYRGYYRTHYHSFWYVRRYDESYSSSVRENSVGGNRMSQRGLSGGK